MSGRYLGIDIGGSKSAVLLGMQGSDQQSMQCLVKKKFATKDYPLPEQFIPYLLAEIKALLQESGCASGDLAGVGISCGGPLDSRNGLILSPPNLPGWDRVPIIKLLQTEFSVPIRLQNDANAGALAEWNWGAGRNCRNVIFLTFGTGLGAGLILNGQLYSGSSDMAGECGHMRLADFGPVGYGKAGSFEGFCSGGGLAQLGQMKARELLQAGTPPAWCPEIAHLQALNAAELAAWGKKGDASALEVFALCGEYLGRGLAVLVDLLNPERIILGSIFARAEGLLRSPMKKALQREALPQSLCCCQIVPAALGEEIGDFAALAVASGRGL